ncbi:histidine phosphatase family protein [Butyrivibrio fibrisolvens]|nr:histidine phosphatase family protein [Butyrivibrio fibrisolvens]
MRLIFVRHGEPNYENDCLTQTGKEQAIKTAERLKNENIKAIYSSPMGRAIETASFTAKDHGLEIEKLDFMHEIWWGDKDKDSSEKIPLNGHPWSIAYNVLTELDDYVAGDKWK